MTRRFDPRGLTAGTVVRIAQIALLAIGCWALPGYVSGSVTDEQAARGAMALGIFALIAAPRHRGAHLLGAVAIWLTTCEFMAATRTGEFALWRWAVALATLAVIMIMTRLPEFRAGARANPWRRMGSGVRSCRPAHVAIEGNGRWICVRANSAR